MKKRILTMLSMLFLGILFSGAINAQGIRVLGKVTDAADGSSLVGVTIQEKREPLMGLLRMVMGTSSLQLPRLLHWSYHIWVTLLRKYL